MRALLWFPLGLWAGSGCSGTGNGPGGGDAQVPDGGGDDDDDNGDDDDDDLAGCDEPAWDLWAADADGACACYADDDDLVGGWCALRAGDPTTAVQRFRAGEGDDLQAGLAVALDLDDDPVAAGAAASAVLVRTPRYAFAATGLDADDLRVLAARGALLEGRIADYRADLRALSGTPPNPHDPGDWDGAPTALEASLAALEVVP